MREFIIGLVCLFRVFSAMGQLDSTVFRHHVIDSPLPGPPEYGTGGFTLADYDRDGDLDITLSRRADSAKVYWYENRQGNWIIHPVGVADEWQLGAAAADINLDGFPDLVMGRYWFENPGILKEHPGAPFLKHDYYAPRDVEIHDIIAVDLNNDGKPEIITYCQNESNGTLRWYETSDADNWVYHDVAVNVNASVNQPGFSKGIHGGLAPGGAGDLNNDGYADIVMPHGWYKNPGHSADSIWQLVSWPFHLGRHPNPYGVSIRSWVGDLDADDDNDIILTDCDVENSAGYWIENINNGEDFLLHLLPSPGDPTGSFHSLVVADFDLDGDPDIFSGEQEDPDPGMKPGDLKERGFIWKNEGGEKFPSFVVRILQTDNPGWHDAIGGDVDGDGDVDIVSKIWNKDGDHYHADYWENLINK